MKEQIAQSEGTTLANLRKYLSRGCVLAATALAIVVMSPQGLNSHFANSVNAMNSKAAPAPARNADHAVMQPFEQQVALTAGRFSFSGNITVPAGKRLVIQDVNFIELTAGSILSVQATSNSLLVPFFCAPQSGSDVFVFDLRGPIYVDPGGFATIALQTAYASVGTRQATVTGYYVNVP